MTRESRKWYLGVVVIDLFYVERLYQKDPPFSFVKTLHELNILQIETYLSVPEQILETEDTRMAGIKGRKYLIILLIIGITLPTINCEEITERWQVSYRGTVQIVVPVDLNGDGISDGGVIGTDAGEVICVDASGVRWKKTGLDGVYGASPADLNGDGYDDAIIVGANDVIAYDLDGNEIWKYPIDGSAYSIAVTDTDSDGKDEVFAGAWKGAYLLDDNGNTIFSLDSSVIHTKAEVAFATTNRILYSDGAALRALDFTGNLKWGTSLDGSVAAGSPADLDGDGIFDDVVVGDLEGKLYGFDENGARKWKIEKYFEFGYKIIVSPIDLDYDGEANEILWSTGAVYLINPDGSFIWTSKVADPKGVAPIDFDGDGILDDVIVGTNSNIYALDSEGYTFSIGDLDKYSSTGSNGMVAVDLDSDGVRDDFISAYDKFFHLSGFTTSFRDITTRPPTAMPLPTTSPPATTSPPETLTPTTTPPPVTTQPAAEDNSELEELRQENERLQMELEKARLEAEQSKGVCGPTLISLLVLIPLLGYRNVRE